MDFTESQIRRYARHIILPEIGGHGQAKLLAAKVLVIGAGGLGAPLLLYLAAAGVGTIGVVDDDVVDLSNLQRQVIHDVTQIDVPKALSAAKRIAALNPEIRVEPHATRLTAANALELIGGYDLVADGSDNFDTRYLLNDACHLARKPLVSAALLRFDGQIATFKAWQGREEAGEAVYPCYRCLFRHPPPPGTVPSCSQAGVLGALAGLLGSLQAVEVLKELLGIGESLAGCLLLVDALNHGFRKVRVRPDPECPLCGLAPTITDLSAHALRR